MVNVQYMTNTRGRELTSAGSSSYTARSIILTLSSEPSGAQVTDFFLPSFRFESAGPEAAVVADVGGGVAVAGESLRGLTDLRISSNGLYDDGCATLGSGSFFTAAEGAFLKSGSLGFGFEAEKNDVSVFASFTEGFPETILFVVIVVFDDDATVVTEPFFASGAPLLIGGGSSALRFLLLTSASIAII